MAQGGVGASPYLTSPLGFRPSPHPGVIHSHTHQEVDFHLKRLRHKSLQDSCGRERPESAAGTPKNQYPSSPHITLNTSPGNPGRKGGWGKPPTQRHMCSFGGHFGGGASGYGGYRKVEAGSADANINININ